MSSLKLDAKPEELLHLASPKIVRERAARIFERSSDDAPASRLRIRMDKLEVATEYVVAEILRNYPTLQIPPHSRYEHLRAGGRDRIRELDDVIAELGPVERARAKTDLVIVAVLLDAGAGAQWSYTEDGKSYARSEGLAVASYQMFRSGMFSSDAGHPCRVDANRLSKLTADDLRKGFQVSDSNPMVGLEGRAELLKKLGDSCRTQREFFGAAGDGGAARPGYLVDYAFSQAKGDRVSAVTVLRALLHGLSGMWPPRAVVGGVAFGDVWHSPLLGDQPSFETLMPFHKLSQWLAYSLFEPFAEAGLVFYDERELTGLPEYRNGGLLLDLGVLELRDPADATRKHGPDSPLIIEWRALTIALLDRLAARVRGKLDKSESEMPLTQILQGGTWLAGRRIAAEKRPGATPPLDIESDGTVF